MNWKTLLVGTVATVVITLIFQLLFIVVAIGIGMSSHDSWFIAAYKKQLWFATALLTHCLSLAAGGLVTVYFAEQRPLLHAAVVGVLASIITLATSMANRDFSLMSGMLVVLGALSATLSAGIICRRRGFKSTN